MISILPRSVGAVAGCLRGTRLDQWTCPAGDGSSARPSAREGKPLVPESAWPLLLTLRSVRGDKPLIGLPDFRRVLVLAGPP